MLLKFKKLFGAQDMTEGKPLSCLLLFSIPLLIGNIAQVLYSTVNSIIVGQFLGDTALAAVGASWPIQFTFFVFFMTIGTGVTVLVAQFYGAKDYQKLSDVIGSSFSMLAVSSIIIMCIAAPMTGLILKATNTPVEIFDMAEDYLFVTLIGCAGTGFYNIISGTLRGLGESVFPLVVLLITVILNALLDLLAVAVLDWGVAGAALATVICQIISAVACLFKVLKIKNLVKLDRQALRPKKQMIKHILRLGLPAGISQGIFCMSFVLVQSIINSMGYLVATACATVARVDAFAILPNQAFSMAASTYTGQNIGAGRWDRVNKGAKTVVIMGLIAAIVLVSFILIFGKDMLRMFTDTQEVIDMGIKMLSIMAIGYIANSFMQTYSGIMRGSGDTMATMWITIIFNVLIRIPIAYIWAHYTKSAEYPGGNPDAIYYSLMISWLIGTVITYMYYRTGKWKTKTVIKPSAAPSGNNI